MDTGHEVLDIIEEDIEVSPSFGHQVNTEFVLGMGTKQGGVTSLLAIDKVLNDQEDRRLAGHRSQSPGEPPKCNCACA